MIFDVHSDLKRYVSAAFLVSAGVGVFGMFFLILGVVRTPSWPFIIFGIVAILTAYLGTAIVPRHYRYASRVVCFRNANAATHPSRTRVRFRFHLALRNSD